MSLLSDLVHLRTTVEYIYSGPLLRNRPVSVIDDVVVKCSLGQLVRGNTNFRLDLLKELCRARHVEGYSRRNPLAKELSLQALLWSCNPNCNACSNGVFGHQVRWVPEHRIKREESGIWKVLTNSTLTDGPPTTHLRFFSLTGRTHPSPTSSSTERFNRSDRVLAHEQHASVLTLSRLLQTVIPYHRATD
ncbi:BZ3500_MvSof-1268-A1-R1_Chr3-3g06413 [Microbotryum saponariae]|uniref:BZ3500_MvSof-1268-A1-R1_Chr3-3g06413 protein n=1 Tax=Microbotryum saponariae TaxID=289078 RepID=A0A2X0LGW3_9BASI|nr:BZ3500_MvSof-1268-A1-R1_Chr3-3g06413 [Microbotryum saponariae]SDA04380.1 BZ3501_MvSof-1269-A2-R1_Chr3-2g06100 [Microbotryum saponariae]